MAAAPQTGSVIDAPPEAPPPNESDGFRVRRNAARGFLVGGVVAAAVFVLFALVPGTAWPTGLYLGLAVVLWVSIGLLATMLLVAWRVRRLARTL